METRTALFLAAALCAVPAVTLAAEGHGDAHGEGHSSHVHNDRYGPGSGPKGADMTGRIDKKSTHWWSRRANATGQAPTKPNDTPNSVAPVRAEEARGGWDPGDVWLHRIEQPRRRRTKPES